MGGETHDKLPAKVIFRVKVKYTTFSVDQMNKDAYYQVILKGNLI